MSHVNAGVIQQIKEELYKENNIDIRLQRYTEYLLANYCMPTLLKLKPACLFHVNTKNIDNSQHFIRLIEREITYFDCEAITLYTDEMQLILLVFQKELLREVIDKEENRSFLQAAGYACYNMELEKLLGVLRQRYRNFITKSNKRDKVDFPHEIGIILGYPVMDVEEFIKNKGKNYLICGYWKVYHDTKAASIMFERFQEAREKAMQWIISGKSLREYQYNGGYYD